MPSTLAYISKDVKKFYSTWISILKNKSAHTKYIFVLVVGKCGCMCIRIKHKNRFFYWVKYHYSDSVSHKKQKLYLKIKYRL